MPPDLNSLPPSRSTSSSPLQARNPGIMPSTAADPAGTGRSPSRRSSSVSLAAAATMNAADLSRRSSTTTASNRASPQTGRVHERRRSAVAMNLSMNDPTMPGPGELSSSDHRLSVGNIFRNASPTSLSRGGVSPIVATGDPHHHRTPSLGELHQELEQEQEAQVNRLLLMIRQQQAQLQQMHQLQQQSQQAGGGSGTTAIIDDSTPTSERSISFPTLPPLPTGSHRSSVHLPHSHSARRGSNQASPIVGLPGEIGVTSSVADLSGLSGDGAAGRRSSRDETTFYQAETAALNRENQMLRMRIRELERQISELTTSPRPHTPTTSSNLASSSSVTEDPTPSSSEAEASHPIAAIEPEKT